ncbi:MAG: zinc-ribbon domain-containing protein [Gemmatimonadota bacterium]
MTVECPTCNTRFPVDPEKIPEGGVFARCSECDEVFFVEEPTAAPLSTPEEELQEPSSSLEPEEELQESPSTPEEVPAPMGPEPTFEEPASPAEEPAPSAEESETQEIEGLPLLGEADEETEGEPDQEAEGETDEETEGEADEEAEATEPVLSDAEPTFQPPQPAFLEEEPLFETGEAEVEPSTEGVEPGFGDSRPAPDEAEPTFGEAEQTFSLEYSGFEIADEEAPVAEDEPSGEDEPSAEDEPPAQEETRGMQAPAMGFDPAPAVPEAPEPEAPPVPEPSPEPLPTPRFGRRDPQEKAQRLARVLVSDIILYNPDRHQRALEAGRIKEEFDDEIQKSWNEYVEQVGEEVVSKTDFFNQALNEILAKGQRIF